MWNGAWRLKPGTRRSYLGKHFFSSTLKIGDWHLWAIREMPQITNFGPGLRGPIYGVLGNT
jgi:hypothetical protein